jgi:hypothetical protein
VSEQACCARVGMSLPLWAPRRGALCANAAKETAEVRLGEDIIELPLCRVHALKLRVSSDPVKLARSWRQDAR